MGLKKSFYETFYLKVSMLIFKKFKQNIRNAKQFIINLHDWIYMLQLFDEDTINHLIQLNITLNKIQILNQVLFILIQRKSLKQTQSTPDRKIYIRSLSMYIY